MQHNVLFYLPLFPIMHWESFAFGLTGNESRVLCKIMGILPGWCFKLVPYHIPCPGFDIGNSHSQSSTGPEAASCAPHWSSAYPSSRWWAAEAREGRRHTAAGPTFFNKRLLHQIVKVKRVLVLVTYQKVWGDASYSLSTQIITCKIF